MDAYRSVYDHPIVRGTWASMLLIGALWWFFLGRSPDHGLFFPVFLPQTLSDWFWIGGALTAAHIAGFVSGFLRTSSVWLVISVAATPVYWSFLFNVCGSVDVNVCRSEYAPVVYSVLLTGAFVMPIVLLSGFQLAARRKPKRIAHTTSSKPRAGRPM